MPRSCACMHARLVHEASGALLRAREKGIWLVSIGRCGQVVYEDEDIACVIKPPGIPTQARPFKRLPTALYAHASLWLQ